MICSDCEGTADYCRDCAAAERDALRERLADAEKALREMLTFIQTANPLAPAPATLLVCRAKILFQQFRKLLCFIKNHIQLIDESFAFLVIIFVWILWISGHINAILLIFYFCFVYYNMNI